MRPTFVQGVRTFIVTNFLFGKDSELDNDASFLDQRIIDSTGVLELVSFLEETYGIEITEDELIPENLDSVNQIVAFLATKVGSHLSNASPQTTIQAPNAV
jgi:acyl carrier protein